MDAQVALPTPLLRVALVRGERDGFRRADAASVAAGARRFQVARQGHSLLSLHATGPVVLAALAFVTDAQPGTHHDDASDVFDTRSYCRHPRRLALESLRGVRGRGAVLPSSCMRATSSVRVSRPRRTMIASLVGLLALTTLERVSAHAKPPVPSARSMRSRATRDTVPALIDSARADQRMDGMMGAMARDEMEAHHSPEEAQHMRMTAPRPATRADSGRLTAVADSARRAVARYADVAAAQADGYRMFLPEVRHQRVYHYTNYTNAVREAFRFDPARPTSLLYRDGPDGRKVLTGVMYTAPAAWTDAALDARVPLSLAPWHQHVRWCLPPRGATARWTETRAGKPVFGPASPIADRAACDAVGGVFHERVFGWMVHVDPFAGSGGASRRPDAAAK